METIVIILTATALAFLSGFLACFSVIWYIKKEEIIEEIGYNFIESLSRDEELMKSMYQIGGIIGSGVKGGIGLETPQRRGGKFKWQDLAIDIASQFIQKSINNPSPSPEPLPLPSSQDIITKKVRDKW